MVYYKSRTVPYHHQDTYQHLARRKDRFGLFADMGTGKTKMLVDELGQMWCDELVEAVLIVGLKGQYEDWVREIDKHMDRQVPRHVHVWTGSDSQRSREAQRQLCSPFPGLRILVMNVEACAASKRARELAQRFMTTSRKRAVIVDESTRIKDPSSASCDFMCRMARLAEFRRVATGNHSPNSPLDIWGQFLFLDAGRPSSLGFSSFYAFRARYCIMQSVYVAAGRTVQKPIAFQNLDELHHRIARHSFRVLKSECLDLPPKVYQLHRVEMTPEQRRAYDDMRRMSVATLSAEREVSAVQAMAQLQKLYQITCGAVIVDGGGVVEIPNRRLGAMLDAVEQSGRQTIVWCAYRANAAACARELRRLGGGDRVVEYHGGVDQTDRRRAIDRFQSGDAHFFVGTPQAGGRGITLTAAKTVIYYSNSLFNLEHRDQSEDRAHRIGQSESVTYLDLMVPGTIDEKNIWALRKKINVSSQLLGDGWKEWVV